MGKGKKSHSATASPVSKKGFAARSGLLPEPTDEETKAMIQAVADAEKKKKEAESASSQTPHSSTSSSAASTSNPQEKDGASVGSHSTATTVAPPSSPKTVTYPPSPPLPSTASPLHLHVHSTAAPSNDADGATVPAAPIRTRSSSRESSAAKQHTHAAQSISMQLQPPEDPPPGTTAGAAIEGKADAEMDDDTKFLLAQDEEENQKKNTATVFPPIDNQEEATPEDSESKDSRDSMQVTVDAGAGAGAEEGGESNTSKPLETTSNTSQTSSASASGAALPEGSSKEKKEEGDDFDKDHEILNAFRMNKSSIQEAILSNLHSVRVISSELIYPSSQGYSYEHPGRLLIDAEGERIPKFYTKPHLLLQASVLNGMKHTQHNFSESDIEVALFPHWAIPVEPDMQCVARAILFGVNPSFLRDCTFRPETCLSNDAKALVRGFREELADRLATVVESSSKNPQFLPLCRLLGYSPDLDRVPSGNSTPDTPFPRSRTRFENLINLIRGHGALPFDAAMVASVLHDKHAQEVRYSSVGEFEATAADRAPQFDMPQGLTFICPSSHCSPNAPEEKHAFPFEEAGKDRFSYLFSSSDPSKSVSLTASGVGHASALCPAPNLFTSMNHPLKALYPVAMFPVIYQGLCSYFFTPYLQFDRPNRETPILHIRTGSIVTIIPSELQPDFDSATKYFVLATAVKMSHSVNKDALVHLSSELMSKSKEVKSGAWNSIATFRDKFVGGSFIDPVTKEDKIASSYYNHLPPVPVGLVIVVKLPGTESLAFEHVRTISQIRAYLADEKQEFHTRLVTVDQIATVDKPFNLDKHKSECNVREYFDPHTEGGYVKMDRQQSLQLKPFDICKKLDLKVVQTLVESGLRVYGSSEGMNVDPHIYFTEFGDEGVPSVEQLFKQWLVDISQKAGDRFESVSITNLSKIFKKVICETFQKHLTDAVRSSFLYENPSRRTGPLSQETVGSSQSGATGSAAQGGRSSSRTSAMKAMAGITRDAQADNASSATPPPATPPSKGPPLPPPGARTPQKFPASDFFDFENADINMSIQAKYNDVGRAAVNRLYKNPDFDLSADADQKKNTKLCTEALKPVLESLLGDLVPVPNAYNNIKHCCGGFTESTSIFKPLFDAYTASHKGAHGSGDHPKSNVSAFATYVQGVIAQEDLQLFVFFHLVDCSAKTKKFVHNLMNEGIWRTKLPFCSFTSFRNVLQAPRKSDGKGKTGQGSSRKRAASDAGGVKEHHESGNKRKKYSRVTSPTDPDDPSFALEVLNNSQNLYNTTPTPTVDMTYNSRTSRSRGSFEEKESTSMVDVGATEGKSSLKESRELSELKRKFSDDRKKQEEALKKQADVQKRLQQDNEKLSKNYSDLASRMSEMIDLMRKNSSTAGPGPTAAAAAAASTAVPVIGPSKIFVPPTNNEGASYKSLPNHHDPVHDHGMQMDASPLIPPAPYSHPHAHAASAAAASGFVSFDTVANRWQQLVAAENLASIERKKRELEATEKAIRQQQNSTQALAKCFQPSYPGYSHYPYGGGHPPYGGPGYSGYYRGY